MRDAGFFSQTIFISYFCSVQADSQVFLSPVRTQTRRALCAIVLLKNNPNLTTKNSIAVGDTEGDIPLLEGVEQPICFNPNQALYNHAKLMGWEVVVERKDVIYYL